MKTQSPKSKDFQEVAIMVGGAVTGAIASRLIISAIHTPTAGADEKTAKKESTMLLVKRGAVALGSGYGGAAINGSDDTAKFLRSACIGSATIQAIDGIKDVVGTTKFATSANPTKTQATLRKALGLGCACQDNSNSTPSVWGMGRAKRSGTRSLRGMGIIVEPNNYNPIEEFANSETVVATY